MHCYQIIERGKHKKTQSSKPLIASLLLNSITVLDTNSFTDYQENAEHLNPITEVGYVSPSPANYAN